MAHNKVERRVVESSLDPLSMMPGPPPPQPPTVPGRRPSLTTTGTTTPLEDLLSLAGGVRPATAQEVAAGGVQAVVGAAARRQWRVVVAATGLMLFGTVADSPEEEDAVDLLLLRCVALLSVVPREGEPRLDDLTRSLCDRRLRDKGDNSTTQVMLRIAHVQLTTPAVVTTDGAAPSAANNYSAEKVARLRALPRHHLVLLALANEHVAASKWRLAVSCLAEARRDLVRAFEAGPPPAAANAAAAAAHVDSYLGRLFAQLSVVDEARASFARSERWLKVAETAFAGQSPTAATARHEGPSSPVARAVRHALRILPPLHAALIALATGNFALAMRFFRDSARHLDPDADVTDLARSGTCLDRVFKRPAVPVNNLAVCSLYACDLESATQQLEALVRADPALHLSDGVAFNLCTLYDLSNNNAQAARRKRVLQNLGAASHLDDLDPLSFRIAA